jgi:hypothetical protein
MTTIKVDGLPDVDVDQPATAELESEVRDFVRRDFPTRRPRHGDASVEIGVENLNLPIHGVAVALVEEIERIIGELQTMRDMLRDEGDRVQRELTGYASGSQATMASLKLVAENLARWRAVRPEGRHDQIRHEAS